MQHMPAPFLPPPWGCSRLARPLCVPTSPLLQSTLRSPLPIQKLPFNRTDHRVLDMRAHAHHRPPPWVQRFSPATLRPPFFPRCSPLGSVDGSLWVPTYPSLELRGWCGDRRRAGGRLGVSRDCVCVLLVGRGVVYIRLPSVLRPWLSCSTSVEVFCSIVS